MWAKILIMKKFFILICCALSFAACNSSGSESAEEESNQVDTIQTASGLRYYIIEEGSGEMPEANDIVEVHYTGTLASNGEKFDSSYDRGKPLKFPVGVGKVIPGWDEGIMQLKQGTKAMLLIPSKLAYGKREIPGIPANSDLNFEVELVNVSKPVQHTVLDTNAVEKQVTDNGLEYYIHEEGSGPQAKPGDNVQVHYYGYFRKSGERFDDSYSRGQPFSFTLGQGQVIPGWDQGLTLLKEGSKATLVIPYMLAYGERGGGPIPPKADLVFDVELVKVN